VAQGTIKICLLGDCGVGKTSLVRRFAYNTFDLDYTPSPGLTVSTKTVVVAHDGRPQPCTLVLWDPASSEHSALPYAAFLDSARAVVLVADLARPDSIAALGGYVEQVRRLNASVSFGIAANKVDVFGASWRVPAQFTTELESLARSLNAPLHYTSALRDHEVDALFRALAVRLGAGGDL